MKKIPLSLKNFGIKKTLFEGNVRKNCNLGIFLFKKICV